MIYVPDADLFFPDGEDHFTATARNGRPVWENYQHDRLKAAYQRCLGFDTAIDVGAHVGLLTRTLAQRFRRVLAFEPHPENYECLRRNTAQLPNVTCYNLALDAEERPLGIETATPGNSGDRQIVPGGTGVQAVRLDVVAKPGCVDLIKMDVQGYEPFVLRGARGTLLDFSPVLIIECEPRAKLRRHYDKAGTVDKALAVLEPELVTTIGADRIYAPGPSGYRPYEKYGRLGAYHWAAYESGKTRNMVDTIVTYIDAQHHDGILDVGCGDGLFASKLRRHGTLGIDTDPEAVKLANRHGASAEQRNYFRLPADRHWSAILLFDVLEHMWHQDLALDLARQHADNLYILNPDPNGSEWHQRELTWAALLKLAAEHGWQPRQQQRIEITTRNQKTFVHFVKERP